MGTGITAMSDSPSTTGLESGIDDREVLDVAGAAVIVTDGRGRIVQRNSTTTEMFGWVGDEAPRRIVQTLLASGGPQRRANPARGAAARLVPSMPGDGRVPLFPVERIQRADALAPLRESARDQDLAIIFQEALLPDDLPSIAGIDVAARYRPGIADIEVGGDFYDIVAAGSDHWALVIGDICGRGPAAAAQTGRVRHSFRMSAWHEDTPVEILDWLDKALRTGGDGILCTAAVASLERAADDTFELTCALGGHPRPILCRAVGSVEYFGEYGTLLGTDLTVHNAAVSTAIEPGDAVFFYTDGITDSPPPHDLSQSRLLGLVGEAWADRPDASVLADRVLTEADRTLSLDERTDDIALLVLRRT